MTADDPVERIRQSPGWELRSELNYVITARRVFLGNHAELQHAVTVVHRPDEWLPIIDDDGTYAVFSDELDRLLHNYLASAYSLSSVAFKVAKKRWGGSRAMHDYLAEAPFGNDPISDFMFGLRSASQHERIPLSPLRQRVFGGDDGPRLVEAFILNVEDLRALDWSRAERALTYLNALDEDPDLLSLVEHFTSAMWKFTLWFEQAFMRRFKPEFKELALLNEEWKGGIPRGKYADPREFLRLVRARTRTTLEAT